MWVENRSDELWVGVKGQSSSEIAGSPRNVLRYGLGGCLREVEHCMGEGSHPTDQATPNAQSGTWETVRGDNPAREGRTQTSAKVPSAA